MRKVVGYANRHLAQEDHLKETKTREELEDAKSTIRSVLASSVLMVRGRCLSRPVAQSEELGTCALSMLLSLTRLVDVPSDRIQ